MTEHPPASPDTDPGLPEDPDLLAAEYTLGLLSTEGERLAAASLASDRSFRAAVGTWSARFDAHDEASPAPLPEGLWARIDAAIDDLEILPGTATQRADAGVWEALGHGIQRRLLHVDRAAGTQSYYMRMRQGTVLPEHFHPMTEQCVVLEGVLRIGEARVAAGDFHLALAGHTHAPIAAETDTLFFIHGSL